MCSFPAATVKNYHKASGLKQWQFFLSYFWRPEFGNQFHQAEIKAMLPPEAISALAAAGMPSSMATSLLSLPTWPCHLLLCCVQSPSASLLQGHLWRHLEPTQINQNNLRIFRSKYSPICHVPFASKQAQHWQGSHNVLMLVETKLATWN